jgi:hypothetical protein
VDLISLLSALLVFTASCLHPLLTGAVHFEYLSEVFANILFIFFCHRLKELVRFELLRRHKGRVADAVVDVDPRGSTGLGEKLQHSSSK